MALCAVYKTLVDSDDGILVYVCPTKPLVNQTVCEVLSYIDKKYDYPHHMIGNHRNQLFT